MKDNLFSGVTASNALSSYSLRRRRPFFIKRWFIILTIIVLVGVAYRLLPPDLAAGEMIMGQLRSLA